MLKTNSKQAKENLKNYIMENFEFEGYCNGTFNNEPVHHALTYKEVCNIIYNTFINEKRYNKPADFKLFKDWAQGLPSILDTCYYYNRSAVDDLKKILEQTDEEANKYTEEQAEEMLTKLLYREIVANK